MANQRSTGLVTKSKPAQQQAVLNLDPERIIAGMVFHLIDERHAVRVCDASIRNTRKRLRHSNLSLVIAREHWEAMGNEDRLQWLLSRSHTQAIYSGRTAILAANN